MSNWSRREFVQGAAAAFPLAHAASAQSETAPVPTREYWIHTLTKVGDPVLSALSARRLKATMPVEAPHGNADERRQFTHLEALGRLLSGMAPWLESGASSGPEASRREHYCDLSRKAIAAGVDPHSPDYMNFSKGSQPVVDAAFLALAVLRAPRELWEKLDRTTKRQLVEAMRSSRVILPGYNNWLLFSATVEAFLFRAQEDWDKMRVDYAVRSLNEFYKGDGLYGDGPAFHWDYYNSFVMHSMLLAVVETFTGQEKFWDKLHPVFVERSRRYADIQERLINPDGSYPAIGRSITYRCGAFQLLADMALKKQLPQRLAPAQAREALTAVIRRTLDAPGTFDTNGWLTVGLCGHQPSLGEGYISTGSLYLCSNAFLPLGLPASDPFWSGTAEGWTSQKIW
ncbi:MAG TPA: DUF2264 domain-containing protein, partial [Bryobacteraceae bacterium]